MFSKAQVNDVNWALRKSEPDFKWGLGSEPEDEDVTVVLAAPCVELATVLDVVVGTGAWRWRRGIPGD